MAGRKTKARKITRTSDPCHRRHKEVRDRASTDQVGHRNAIELPPVKMPLEHKRTGTKKR
jgi:hypothetical protein